MLIVFSVEELNICNSRTCLKSEFFDFHGINFLRIELSECLSWIFNCYPGFDVAMFGLLNIWSTMLGALVVMNLIVI